MNVGGFENDDLGSSSHGANDRKANVMNWELADGLTVREALSHIERCREERHKNPKAKIEVPGLSWNGCSYNKIL